MGKPLSWKWRLVIAGVCGALFVMAAVFSPWGQDWYEGRIRTEFAEMPASDRRDSDLADRYLWLAWWRSVILQDSKSGMRMYRDFLGLPRNLRDDSFFKSWDFSKDGLCSEDGKTGWGPLHPRAPEAYWRYLELFEVEHSSQFTHAECCNYYRMFYTWMLRNADNRRPHPQFNVYWPKIKNLMSRGRALGWPVDIDPKAPLAPPAPKEESQPK